MSQRLTKKKKHYDSTDIDEEYKLEEDVSVGEAVDKLGQLEDVEQELGIDLITLIKALKKGFYDENEEYHHFSNLFIDDIEIFDSYEKVSFYLKDYGKTWALTKGELEND